MALDYLCVFITGGIICLLGQILSNLTKMTSARILVIFLLLGVALELVGAYQYIEGFGKAGATVPIVGFGSGLARGAIKGASENGILGAISGGKEAVAPGICSAIVFAFVTGLISKSKTK